MSIERGWQDLDSPIFTNVPTYRGPFYDVPETNVRNEPRGICGATTYSRFDQEVRSFYVQDRVEWGAFGVRG